MDASGGYFFIRYFVEAFFHTSDTLSATDAETERGNGREYKGNEALSEFRSIEKIFLEFI